VSSSAPEERYCRTYATTRLQVSQILEVNFMANFSSRTGKPGYEGLTGLAEGCHCVLCVREVEDLVRVTFSKYGGAKRSR
jgi:hypothetical protein